MRMAVLVMFLVAVGCKSASAPSVDTGAIEATRGGTLVDEAAATITLAEQRAAGEVKTLLGNALRQLRAAGDAFVGTLQKLESARQERIATLQEIAARETQIAGLKSTMAQQKLDAERDLKLGLADRDREWKVRLVEIERADPVRNFLRLLAGGLFALVIICAIAAFWTRQIIFAEIGGVLAFGASVAAGAAKYMATIEAIGLSVVLAAIALGAYLVIRWLWTYHAAGSIVRSIQAAKASGDLAWNAASKAVVDAAQSPAAKRLVAAFKPAKARAKAKVKP